MLDRNVCLGTVWGAVLPPLPYHAQKVCPGKPDGPGERNRDALHMLLEERKIGDDGNL